MYLILMLFSICVNFVCGLALEKHKAEKKIFRLIFLGSLFTNLGLLTFFKYGDFLLRTLNQLWGTSLGPLDLPLPIGISFYTFQVLSYVIDLYRGEISAQRDLLNFALYVSLFPQLIAGPIIRYQQLASQLEERQESFNGFGQGVQHFIAGLAKKVLMANSVGHLWHEIQQIPPAELTTLTAWLGIVAFALQIYFDFSGYSAMAVGLGKMFGFSFPENFRYPYLAQSITEFWQCWHISLGSWFREYVYIPMGGNSVGKIKLFRNLLLVWLLTGLWHGASWNFVVWGLYYGLILIMEKTFLLQLLEKLPGYVRHLYTCLLVLLGWVLFAFDKLSLGLSYIQVMFGMQGQGLYNRETFYLFSTNAILLIILFFAATPLVSKLLQKIEFKAAILHAVLQAIILVLATAYLVDASYNPFLYFRF